LLVVGCDQLGHLDKHFFFFLLVYYVVFWKDCFVCLHYAPFFDFVSLVHADGEGRVRVDELSEKDFDVAIADYAEGLHEETFHQLAN
jgi:hypothetical protein